MSDSNKVQSFSSKRLKSKAEEEDQDELVEDLDVEDELAEDVEVEEVDVEDGLEVLDELEDASAQDTTSVDTHIEGMNILKKLADLSSTFMSAGKTESAIKLADVIKSSVGDLIPPTTAKATIASIEKEIQIPNMSSKKTY